MYRFNSAPAARRDSETELRQELDRLREENERLHGFMDATQPVLANLVLNPFSDIDALRSDARAALALGRRRDSAFVRFGH